MSQEGLVMIELGLGIILLVWLMILTGVWWKTYGHYRRLTKGTDKKDLMGMLDKLLTRMSGVDQDLKELTENQDNIASRALGHVQKVGLVRFNPFTDTGGNQSFCLALLDGQENGIMISSLHSREQTRIYAKRIVAGKTEGAELSREEKEALKRAQET